MHFDKFWARPLLDYLDMLQDFGGVTRGVSYALNHKVLKFSPNGVGRITVLVQGRQPQPYKTVFFLRSEDGEELRKKRQVDPETEELFVDVDCSCPIGGDCKHAYASVLTLLYAGYAKGSRILNGLANEWLPRDWANGDGVPSDKIFEELDYLFQPEPEDADLVIKLPGNMANKSASPEFPWWREYVEATDSQRRLAVLLRVARTRVKTGKWGWWPVESALSSLNRLGNPMETLRRFGATLEELKKKDYSMHLLPESPGLAEFLASEEAQELTRAFEERQMREHLLRWLQPAKGAENIPPAQAEVVWTTYRAESGASVLGWQLLLTTQKLQRSPRKASAVIQLVRDIEGNRRKVSPAEAQLVSWLAQQPGVFLHSGGAAREEAVPLPVYNVLEWACLWGERGMLFWTDGKRVEFEPHAAKLILQADTDGKTLWAVRFPEGDAPESAADFELLADGDAMSPQSVDPRVYIRRENKLIRLETGGMPVDLLSRIQRMPEVPIDLLRQHGAGVALVERLRLSEGTNNDAPGLVRVISVTPVLEFVLADGKELTVVVRADGESGERFYRNASGHWNLARNKEVETTPVGEADPALCLFPNAAELEPIDAFLQGLIPASATGKVAENGAPSLTWSLNGKAFDRFLSAWSKRPAQAQFLGNKPFYNMVMLQKPPGLRVRVESSGLDWLKVSVEMEGEMEALNLNEVRSALTSSQEALIALPGGRMYRREDLEEYERSAGALMDMGLVLQGGEQRVHAMQLAGMKKDALMELGGVNPNFLDLAGRARALLENFQGIPAAPVHAETAHFLRPYQQQGADFVYWACQSFGGAVLADDMGLGKTLQILAALTALRAQCKEVLPSLVICPASVSHNWQRETRRFAPMLRVVTLESGAGRREILKHADKYDIVIMNYALARRDVEHLQKIKWLSICVDEAQAIKNPDSTTSQVLKKIQASYRIALTGTPVENRLLDLWSILDFAAPGTLPGRREFEQQAKSEDPSRLYRVLRAKLRPLLIRRLKTEVAPELPPRIEERRDCEMAPGQRKAYLAEVKRTRELLVAMREKKLAGKDRFQMLAALTRLRQICCDPSLIGLEKCGSGKTDTLLEIVEELLESGHKTLIFSQFVQMLERLKTALQKKGVPLRMLTGETRNRKELVDEFEGDPTPSVFLISLKAGGTGLNLTSASYVILYDPWWNPAVEAQAIDRTHRIGQDKTVVAYRLVTEGTVEERILALQEQKRGLAKNLLEEESFNRALTRDDFEYLLAEEAEEE